MVITLDNTLQVWMAGATAAFRLICSYVLCFVVVFVFVSAKFAWTNESFDLELALWQASVWSIGPTLVLYQPKWLVDMPLLYSKSKKLVKKEARLAQSRAELQDEAEQMKTLHRLENED